MKSILGIVVAGTHEVCEDSIYWETKRICQLACSVLLKLHLLFNCFSVLKNYLCRSAAQITDQFW